MVDGATIGVLTDHVLLVTAGGHVVKEPCGAVAAVAAVTVDRTGPDWSTLDSKRSAQRGAVAVAVEVGTVFVLAGILTGVVDHLVNVVGSVGQRAVIGIANGSGMALLALVGAAYCTGNVLVVGAGQGRGIALVAVTCSTVTECGRCPGNSYSTVGILPVAVAVRIVTIACTTSSILEAPSVGTGGVTGISVGCR